MIRSYFENPKNKDCPRILVTAGVHGNELTAMKAAARIVDYINYCMKYSDYIIKDMHFSSITVLNYVNMYGIIHNTRNTGYDEDQYDLNRGYTVQEDIRDVIKHEIDKADIVIDIHSSPRMINALWLVDNGSKFPRNTIISCCDLPIVVRNSTGSTIKSYAMSLDKFGLTLETNGLDIIDIHSADVAKCAVLDLMRNADKILEDYKRESPVFYPENKLFSHIKSDISGFIEYPSSAPYISPDGIIRVIPINDPENPCEYNIPSGSFSVELHERDFINKGEDLIGYMPNIDD